MYLVENESAPKKFRFHRYKIEIQKQQIYDSDKVNMGEDNHTFSICYINSIKVAKFELGQ